MAKGGIVDEGADFLSHGGWIAFGDEEAVFAVGDHIRIAAEGRRDAGNAEAHAFGEGEGGGFRTDGAVQVHVHKGVIRRDVVHEPGEDHMIRYPERARLCFQLRPARTVPDEQEAHVRMVPQHDRRRFKQIAVPLVRLCIRRQLECLELSSG